MNNLPDVKETKKSIRYATIQSLGMALIVVIGIIIFSRILIRLTENNEKQKIKDELVEITTLARHSIESDIENLRSGEVSKEETQQIVKSRLRNMNYVDKYGENYIFLVDYHGDILVQPYQPWLEDTNQWDMQDKNGVFLIRELIKAARSKADGDFVTYFYKPPHLENEEEKLSFAVDIPELECIIGTGKYMRLYYADQTAVIQRTSLIACLFALIIVLLSMNSLRRIRITGNKLEAEIVQRGEIQRKLFDSEINLRAVFNSMSDIIIIHTADGIIIETNDRVVDMFGCGRDDLIGKNISEISAAGEFSKDRLLSISRDVQLGKTLLVEYRVKRLDNGEEFFVEVAIKSVSWYGQTVILAVVRNIQERKFIERELRKSQLMNEQAEEMGLFGNYTIDLLTQVTKWSKGLYKIFQRDENLPPPDSDEYQALIVPEDRKKVEKIQETSCKTGKTQKVEYRIRRPDGEVRSIYVIMDWLQEGEEKKRYILGSIQDVTEKNKAIEEIRLSEEKFRTTVHQMADGLILVNEEGIVIEWNRAIERITGILAGKMIGRSIRNNEYLINLYDTSSGQSNEINKEIQLALQTGKSDYFANPIEMTIFPANGSTRILQHSVFTIKVQNKYRLGVILHDITDERASLEKINHELKKLASLRKIDAAILERETPEKTLEMICSVAVDLLNVDGTIILTRLASDNLTQAFVSNIDTSEDPVVARTLDLQSAALKQNAAQEFSSEKLGQIDQIQPFDTSSDRALNHAILPLMMNKKACGYIQVISREPIPDDQEWKDYFLTLAGQTSIAVENVTLIANEEVAYSELNQAYESTIAGWSKALELRDEETKGHSDRVMHLSCKLARKAGYPQEKLTSFRRGVLLHDIGKMGIPDRILLKPGALNDEEWKIMRLHPGMAYDLLSAIPYLHDSLEVPFAHHEHWDGSGYPRGLKGKDIPLSARIFTIVDVWDALLSDRPYRKGWDPQTIKAYLKDNKSVLFDPDLVALFLEMIEDTQSMDGLAMDDGDG